MNLDENELGETTDNPNVKSNIDAKMKEREKTKRLKDESDWRSFFEAVGWRLLWAVAFAFIGANFIYLSSSEELDYIFPTNVNWYFPTFDPYTLTFKSHAGGSYQNCKPVKGGPHPGKLIGREWPYNMVGPLKSDWDIIQSMKNWIAVTCADTWMAGRSGMKSWLSFFAPPGAFSFQPLQILVAAPISILLSGLAMVFGFMGSLYYALQYSPGWTILGMFMMFTWFLISCVAGTMFVKYLATLCFLPITHDFPAVKDILRCNIKYFVLFYGWLVCGAAFDFLDPTISIMVAIGFLGLLVKSFWSDVRSFVGV